MAKQTEVTKRNLLRRERSDEKSATGVLDEDSNGGPKSEAVADSQKVKAAQKSRIADLDRDTLVDIYHQMLLVRRFEEKSAEIYSAGKIGGFCHLYIGQEAVAIGAISAIRKDDYVLASYREHAHAIAKGMTPDSLMAELYGKATGCSKGKGGSMHMFSKEVNFLGHAIVADKFLPTGVAFASKSKNRSVTYFLCEAAVTGAFMNR